MTSFAFIFGVVPLVVATGAGFEMRRTLGTAVFFGGPASQEGPGPGRSTAPSAGAESHVEKLWTVVSSPIWTASPVRTEMSRSAEEGTLEVVANGERSDNGAPVESGATGSLKPQLVQNLAPSRFCAAQLGHRFMWNALSPNSEYAGR